MSSENLTQRTGENLYPIFDFDSDEQSEQIEPDQIEPDQIESDQIIKLMKQSFILNLIYEYMIKIILNKTNNMTIIKKNIKIVMFVLCLFMLSGFIGFMNYYLTSLLFAYASLKCILWLFDTYNDKIQSAEDSAVTILEYFIVPIITSLISFILLFNPFSILTLIVNIFNIFFGIVFITHKGYRQRLCIFIKNLVINKKTNLPEGELYKFLQTLCILIENFNRIMFNCLHNVNSTYIKLGFSTDIIQSIQILCRDISDTNVSKSYMTKTKQRRH